MGSVHRIITSSITSLRPGKPAAAATRPFWKEISAIRSFTSGKFPQSDKTTSSTFSSLQSGTSSKAPSTAEHTLVDKPESSTSKTSDVATPGQTSSFPALPPWLEEMYDVWKKQSGTAEVLALKQDVSEKSLAFDAASAQVTNARRQLDESMLLWERTNGQHMQLLQRRDSWTTADAQQFAALVSKEVESRTQMEQARSALTQAEKDLSQRQLEYMNAMRKRYHEEQVWQDQWRVLGTYGTWSLIVLNSMIFLGSQFFHYRREAGKLRHLEKLVKESVASQEAFKDSMLAEREAYQQDTRSSKELGEEPPAVSTSDDVVFEKGDSGTKASEEDSVTVETNVSEKSEPGAKEESPKGNIFSSWFGGSGSENREKVENDTISSEKRRDAAKDGQPEIKNLEAEASMQKVEDVGYPDWVKRIHQSDQVQAIARLPAVQKTTSIIRSVSAKTHNGIAKAQQMASEWVKEDLHVPSAVLGATATAALIMIFVSFNSNR